MLPKHVAFIMDGNGRWAKAQGKNRLFGHSKGAEVVDEITTYSRQIGIKAITFYAFSLQNWERPQEEINGLMALLNRYLEINTSKILSNGIRFTVIGEQSKLPISLQTKIKDLTIKSSHNNQMDMCLALSYGAQEEIIQATKHMFEDILNNKISKEQINISLFEKYLWTSHLPPLDLIIRTSGEQRLSNFLMWQAAYAELFFTDTKWPDFKSKEFQQILNDFSHRERRFGKTSEQLKG